MPRFHFNVFDGVQDIDEEGFELADWPTARTEAVRLVGELLCRDAISAAPREHWRLEVTDGTGLVLFRLDVSLATSAAIPAKASAKASFNGTSDLDERR